MSLNFLNKIGKGFEVKLNRKLYNPKLIDQLLAKDSSFRKVRKDNEYVHLSANTKKREDVLEFLLPTDPENQ